MRISFSPQRRDDVLSVAKAGDALTINGDTVDLSGIPDGSTLPSGAISNAFCGEVSRIDGDLHVTLILPHGPNPPASVAFPAPILAAPDGPIALPGGEDGDN